MRTFAFIFLFFLISQSVYAINYDQQGANWGEPCTQSNNYSPIKIDKSQYNCEYTQKFELEFKEVTSQFVWNEDDMTLSAQGQLAHLIAEDVTGEVFEYIATSIYVHTKAEHNFKYQGQPDIEIQIYFDEENAVGKKGIQKAGVALLFSQQSQVELDQSILTQLPVVSGETKSIDLGLVFGTWLKVAPTSRYFYYKGSKTHSPCEGNVNWYVMETPFAINQIDFGSITDYISSKVSTGNYKASEEVMLSTRELKRGGCYPGYWTHSMTSNIAIWYMIPFMVIFFVFTLVIEQEMDFQNNSQYKNDYKTNHILYSILNVSSAIFTRNSRCTLLLCTMIIQMCIESFLYYFTERDDVLSMLAFSFVAVIASKIITFFYGILLFMDYKHQYSRWRTNDKNVELEEYLNVQDVDFYYYFICFFTVVGGWVGICAFMYGQSTEISNLWLIGTFVGYFIDLAVVEVFIMSCGKSTENTIKDCCKKRGTYFDYHTYEKFYYKKLK